MNDVDELFLCKPCAEMIKNFKTVESIKIGPPLGEKNTCEVCGRRRYGYLCFVEFKDITKENENE